MQIFTNPQDLAAQCRSWHAAGEDIALVPTMGYYHAGHEALMDQGRGLAKRLVVSLFVNPTQFGPNEDLSAYPRDIERDTQIAAAHGGWVDAADNTPSGLRVIVHLPRRPAGPGKNTHTVS